MTTFAMYRDLLLKSEGEATIHPVMTEPYRLFGWVWAMCNEGICTKDNLQAAYRRFNLKNIKKRNEALDYLLDNGFIHTNTDHLPKSPEDFKEWFYETFNREPTDKDVAHCRKTGQFVKTFIKSVGMSTRRLGEGVPEYSKQRGGFVKVDVEILDQPALCQKGGRVLQVYMFLLLTASSVKRKAVSVQTNVSRTPYYLYKGETDNGIRTIGMALGMNKDTVSKIIADLEKARLIFTRRAPVGSVKILKIKALMSRKK